MTTTAPLPATLQDDPRLLPQGTGLGGYLAASLRQVKGGELGALPVVLGLFAICVVFQSQNDRFLSPLNLTNLVLQVAAVGTISVGIVLVLLLGEVDLSVGSVSGLCASVMAVLQVNHGQGGVVSVLAALALGAAVGAVHGLFFSRLGVPAFVVTLAGLIGWQGLQLYVLGDQGTVNVPDGFVTQLTSTFFPPVVGLLLAAAAVVVTVVGQLLERRSRTAAGLRPRPVPQIVVRSVVVAVAAFTVVGVLNADRGVPLAAVIFVGFVVLFDVLTRRTTFGRNLFAVGGNAEAARRAGIDVRRIRLTVFVLASTMAAAGGILAASRLLSVSQSSGSGDVLLNAIAAAVIGGTSLFGGRGSAWSALLGILVIGSVSNGLDLLSQPPSVKYMITGAVLLGAVTLDAVARRGRQASGRA